MSFCHIFAKSDKDLQNVLLSEQPMVFEERLTLITNNIDFCKTPNILLLNISSCLIKSLFFVLCGTVSSESHISALIWLKAVKIIFCLSVYCRAHLFGLFYFLGASCRVGSGRVGSGAARGYARLGIAWATRLSDLLNCLIY